MPLTIDEMRLNRAHYVEAAQNMPMMHLLNPISAIIDGGLGAEDANFLRAYATDVQSLWETSRRAEEFGINLISGMILFKLNNDTETVALPDTAEDRGLEA